MDFSQLYGWLDLGSQSGFCQGRFIFIMILSFTFLYNFRHGWKRTKRGDFLYWYVSYHNHRKYHQQWKQLVLIFSPPPVLRSLILIIFCSQCTGWMFLEKTLVSKYSYHDWGFQTIPNQKQFSQNHELRENIFFWI